MGCPLRSKFAKENHSHVGSRKFKTMQRPAYWSHRTSLGAYHHRFHSKHEKGTLWSETRRCACNARFEMEFEMLDLKWSKDDDTKTQCNWLNTSPLHRRNASNKNGPARVKQRMQWKGPFRWPLLTFCSAGLRSACGRNRHELVSRSRHTVAFRRRVCQNPSRVIILGRTPW